MPEPLGLGAVDDVYEVKGETFIKSGVIKKWQLNLFQTIQFFSLFLASHHVMVPPLTTDTLSMTLLLAINQRPLRLLLRANQKWVMLFLFSL